MSINDDQTYKNNCAVNTKELEFWLNNKPAQKITPKVSTDCNQKTKCRPLMSRINKRHIMLSFLNDGSIGVDNWIYEKLDQPCKEELHSFYGENIPVEKMSFNVFSARIKENSLASIETNAFERFESMRENYHQNPHSNITKEDLDSQRQHFKNAEKNHHDSLLELKQALDEAEALRRGYEV